METLTVVNESLLHRLIVASLTDEDRKPEWRGHSNPLAGHCYVASEALFHLSDRNFVPVCLSSCNGTHWYLEDRDSGEFVDLTEGQFHVPVPHALGRRKGFLTKKPSQRAQKVIDKVLDIL